MQLDALLTQWGTTGVFGILIIALSLIKIKPLELNVWQYIFKSIGNAFNSKISTEIKDLNTKVDNLQDNFSQYKEESLQYRARESRSRILRFNDELIACQTHSKEYFDDILEDIDRYEAFCATHTKFPNNKAYLAIQNIKNKYKEEICGGDRSC